MLEPIPFAGYVEIDDMNKPVAIVELGGEITWLTDVLPYKAKLYTHPVKELTDEEMYRLLADAIWAVGLNTDCLDEQNWTDGITVAKAILRKAQEK